MYKERPGVGLVSGKITKDPKMRMQADCPVEVEDSSSRIKCSAQSAAADGSRFNWRGVYKMQSRITIDPCATNHKCWALKCLEATKLYFKKCF